MAPPAVLASLCMAPASGKVSIALDQLWHSGCQTPDIPLALLVAPRRSPAHKQRLGKATLEGDQATSIAALFTAALDEPTAMLQR